MKAYKEVSPCIEVGTQFSAGEHGMETSAAHDHFGRHPMFVSSDSVSDFVKYVRKIGFPIDTDIGSKTPIYSKSSRIWEIVGPLVGLW